MSEMREAHAAAKAERPWLDEPGPCSPSAKRMLFLAGFTAGWKAREGAERGTVNVDRDYLADLERRAGIGGAW